VANHERDTEAALGSACADCGAVIEPEAAQSYAFGEQAVLCWECAIRRGGSYDADEEVWTTPPAVADLPDSRPEE